MKKENKGISLIILVITIIVILILAGAVILSLSQNNPINSASVASFKASISEINSELTLWLTKQYADSNGTFDASTVNVDNMSKTYGGQTISQILKSATGEYANKLQIINGKLVYVGSSATELASAKDAGISTELPYIKDGLVLWYDGVNNGGLGIHNDNTSANKATWVDLSGNTDGGATEDGTLSSFDFNSSNGWTDNSLRFNGRPNLVNFSMTIPNTHTVEFVVIPRRASGYNGIFSVASYLAKTYSAGVTNFLFYNTALSLGSNYTAGASYSKLSLLSMSFYGPTSTKNLYQNNVSKTLNYNGGGESGDFSDYTGFLLGNGGWGTLEGEIYCVRVYNKVLSDSERLQNYNLDKQRFGL